MKPTIVVRNVYKNYTSGGATTPVLEGIDLQILPGECVFLVGPSGSGKTTLLSILGCLLTPDRGQVLIAGQELSGLSDLERALLRRDRLGFVFQRFHLIRGLTAAQNVAVPLTLAGVAPQQARDRALDLLGAVGLAEKAQSHVGNLSTGQCQRVALARALAGDPDVILADEPTASLDGVNGQEVMQLLRKLTSESGKTAVVVTHDARIYSFADRILELDGGRIAPTLRGEDAGLPALAGARRGEGETRGGGDAERGRRGEGEQGSKTNKAPHPLISDLRPLTSDL
ncbi:MAG TPA: ABC transporter ATP-binding protein [Pirellulales bacterium]|nr:ABC transporter ATP-binding protein [Pirellulales bacterium]